MTRPVRPLMPAAWVQRVALLLALATLYVIAGDLGLLLAIVHPSASAVWVPTGITLAAMLLFGYRVWPATMLGAFVVHVAVAGSPASSLSIAVGNTLEGLAGAWLLNRYAGGRSAFQTARGVFLFAGLAAGLSTAISATWGVATLALADLAPWGDFGRIWLTWWLGDATGALVVAPFVLHWTTLPLPRWRAPRAAEAVAMLASMAVVGQLVFGWLVPFGIGTYPLSFLFMPILVAVAFRFGPRGTSSAIVAMSAIAIWGTVRGSGPFGGETQHAALLLLQGFTAVTALTTYALAAVVAERHRVTARLRYLAVTDPLTGLANYGQLMQVAEAEIRRWRRTGRPFALLLFDLDHLKAINDRHGHLVGSRALCRVADALAATCRDIDTAARFGGDEFAVVLPETGNDAAERAARRIAERLAADTEAPPLSVSAGLAVYPRDGDTLDALLEAADRAMYEAKRRRSGGRGGAFYPSRSSLR